MKKSGNQKKSKLEKLKRLRRLCKMKTIKFCKMCKEQIRANLISCCTCGSFCSLNCMKKYHKLKGEKE